MQFVSANQTGAQVIADELNTTTANVLGLSGLETGYGTSDRSRVYNNYFSLKVGRAFLTGAAGTDPTGQFLGYYGASIVQSGIAFATSFQGRRVTGITNPSAFAAALTTAPLAFNSEAGYAQSLIDTIATIQQALNCLQ